MGRPWRLAFVVHEHLWALPSGKPLDTVETRAGTLISSCMESASPSVSLMATRKLVPPSLTRAVYPARTGISLEKPLSVFFKAPDPLLPPTV